MSRRPIWGLLLTSRNGCISRWHLSAPGSEVINTSPPLPVVYDVTGTSSSQEWLMSIGDHEERAATNAAERRNNRQLHSKIAAIRDEASQDDRNGMEDCAASFRLVWIAICDDVEGNRRVRGRCSNQQRNLDGRSEKSDLSAAQLCEMVKVCRNCNMSVPTTLRV